MLPAVWMLLLSMPVLQAQFYLSGTEPASTRWLHLETPQVNLIFPQGHDREAQYLAHTLQQIDTAVRRSLLVRQHRMPLVLHTQSMTSNGFQVWTPRRIEMFSTPSPTQYAQHWLGTLAVHEYRHATQIGALNDALFQPLKWMFGEQPTGILSACLPLWYLEGDAVVTETALTNSGRGRNPGFSRLLRAQLLSGDRWSYEKAYLGSYRDQTPNHYVLGYHLVSWIRSQTGNDIFGRQLEYLGSHPFRMGLSWKKTTGATIRHWYESMADTLLLQWTEQDKNLSTNLFMTYSRANKTYTEYLAPQILPGLDVVAVKTSVGHVARIVRIADGGQEKVLVRPGELTGTHLNYRNGQLVWSETVPDIRWSNRSTTRIRLFDMTQHRTRTVLKRSMLHTPVLSPDNQFIAIIGNDKLYRAVIEVVPTGEDAACSTVYHPSAVQLQSPAWSEDGRSIYVIAVYENHKRIECYSLQDQSWTPVSDWTALDIQHLDCENGWLLFDSPASGLDNVHAIRLEDNREFRLTSARFGAVQGVRLDTAHLVYADFSARGFQLVSARWRPVPFSGGTQPLLPATAAEQFSMAELDSLPADPFPVKPYRKLPHLLHVHSWAPCGVDYDTYNAEGRGLSVASQDLLGQSVSYGTMWYEDNQYHVAAGIKYMGWYPVIDVRLEYGDELQVYERNYMTVARQPRGRAWEFGVHTYIPFDFSRNAWRIKVTPLIHLKYDDGYFLNSSLNVFQRGAWETSYSLKCSVLRRTTVSELAPRMGISLSGQYTHAIQKQDYYGRIGFVRARVYLPGLFDTHRFQIEGGWQHQQAGRFIFNSGIEYPRGYDDNMASLHMSSLKADYLFPLLHPDLSLGRPLYVTRLYINLFYDEARNKTLYYKKEVWSIVLAERTDRLRSTGADLCMNCHFFRFYAPVTLGVRCAWLPEERRTACCGLASISF